MAPVSISRRSSWRCTISLYLISFMIFSLVGLCTSEALVSSSTSFLPRSLWTRGGSQNTKKTKSPLRCVLQVPRSSLAGVGDNNEDGEKTINGVGTRKRNGQANEAFVDYPVPATFVAETSLPTDVGQFRLRAYRNPKGSNEFTGNEPCVIYCADKSPFGHNGELRENLPVRIHDQCLTSEVFRSQR
jgi:hypothetical protein